MLRRGPPRLGLALSVLLWGSAVSGVDGPDASTGATGVMDSAAQAWSLRSGFVDVPGGPVWYEIAEGGPGIPLLTLHGGPGGTSCGLQLLYPLADERPVMYWPWPYESE